jgi:site-specific DNA-methyltransferase (adenine-specific)
MTVLDCFMGSGTTAIACQNTNRNFIGCEISKEYYDKAVLRIKQNQKPQRLF